jgi:hypothetical protein
MKRLLTGIAIAAMMIAGTTSMFAENEVNQRRENQQQRIANGVGNGTMNAHQAAKVEGQEAHINKEVRTDRAANGGKLTPAEHAQVNRQLNHTSNEIYKDKH